MYRFLIACVDCRKRFENASMDADICIRFRWIKSGGIRKRISVVKPTRPYRKGVWVHIENVASAVHIEKVARTNQYTS